MQCRKVMCFISISAANFKPVFHYACPSVPVYILRRRTRTAEGEQDVHLESVPALFDIAAGGTTIDVLVGTANETGETIKILP